MPDHAAIAEAEIAAGVPYDTADPVAVNKARTKAGRAKKDELDVVAALMSQPEGRKWLYGLLARCNIYAKSFNGDPYYTIYHEGQRSIGVDILTDIEKAAPEFMHMMLIEGKQARG